MVKFGKRLEEELIKDGWEDHYIQYKKLKKVISAVSKDEVAGEMVQAFVKKEQFVVKLTDSVDAAATHYTESAARALKLAELACEATTTLLGAATKPTPADALSTHIEGADVLDSLISARFELEDLREFALVNREGVRKILKKWHKKVSTCSEEMSEQVDSVLTGTPLATSDETAHKVSNAMAMLSDMEAKVALKSTAHAAYLKAAITTARNTRSPRPSSSVASSGRASGRRASGLGLALAAADGAAAGVDDVAFTLDGSEAREWRLSLPCGLTWVSRCEIASWWHDRKKRTLNVALYAVGLLVLVCCIILLVAMPERLPKLSVLGVYASILTAVANGANDIANSVGTSVGAKALTLKQAIVLGLTAEALGAMTLGSLVAKTISKGVIAPETFEAQGCEGVLKFGVSMVCVLCGTGLTTLLATLYGLPISASHGVIGGLIAVGLVSQGPGSLGVAAIARTLIAWVASPMIGAVSAAVVYWIILYVVHRSTAPSSRARMLQPMFIAITVAVAAGFIVIKGPSALRVKPVGVGVVASIAIGAGVGLITLVLRLLRGTPIAKQTILKMDSSFSKRFRSTSSSDNKGGESSTSAMEMTSDEEDPHIVGVAPSSAASPAANIEAAVKLEGAEKPFVPLLILSALTVAFAHGANDVGNAVGPLAAVFEATLNGSIAGTPQMPIWVLAIGSAGFVVGIAALGSRTIATVGGKITTLTPSKSFSVQIGAAVAVLSSTVLGLAVSTSHCLVGSVVGVGIASKISKAGGSLNGRMLLKIFIGWGVTIPLAMLVAIFFYAVIMPSYGYDDEQLRVLNETVNATCF